MRIIRPRMSGRWGRRTWRAGRSRSRMGKSTGSERQYIEQCNELQSQLGASRAQIEQYKLELDENRKQYTALESATRRLQSDLRRTYDDAQRNKRMLDERQKQAAEQARINVAKRIMTVADEFSTAIELAQEQNIDSQWFVGFKAMAEKIDKGLEEAGYRRFESLGEEMDPTKHEALATMPTSDDLVGKIVQVVEAGYEDTKTSKIVRVAKVLVGRPNDDA
ncbi:MAG: nucleotide exchange factor GrpE [Chloroflexi bacterium]|nr:nucleotide exchange factor GrpE [Chloroflexota bacterium]